MTELKWRNIVDKKHAFYGIFIILVGLSGCGGGSSSSGSGSNEDAIANHCVTASFRSRSALTPTSGDTTVTNSCNFTINVAIGFNSTDHNFDLAANSTITVRNTSSLDGFFACRSGFRAVIQGNGGSCER